MQAINLKSYYQVLGVDQDASSAEIKKAYFIKIREYPNETHPEQFQELTKAYKVLSNSESKKQYDREINNQGSHSLLNEALKLVDNGDFRIALNKLKALENTYPDDLVIQKNIAYCYLNLNHLEDAKKILLLLDVKYPNNEDILFLLTETFEKLGDDYLARTYVEKQIILNPNEPNHYIRLSRYYVSEGNYDKASKVIEEKFKNGKEAIHDYPLLEDLYFITMIANNKPYHENIINRIKNLPKNVEEKRTLLNMMMKSVEEIDITNNGFKELVSIIKEINNNEIGEVNDWIVNAEAHIRSDLIYYGDSPTGTQNYTVQTEGSDDYGVPSRGSILFSIIFGIIGSIVFTPFGGIIIGIIWYFFAGAIKKIISFLGCLLVIIAIIGGFLSSL